MTNTNLVSNFIEATNAQPGLTEQFFSSVETATVSFFQNTYGGNTVMRYLIALGVFIFLSILIKLFSKFWVNRLLKAAERSDTLLDDVLVGLIKKNTFPLLYFGALYVSTRGVAMADVLSKIMKYIGIGLLTIFMVQFVSTLIRYLLERVILKKEQDESRRKTIRGLLPVVNVVVWIIGGVFLISNLGFDVSAVITGLGIGGIAIALAAQAMLGDFFSYFTILFDRPFELGDFIIVGDYMGTIEHIGLKTTRIRSLDGEQVVMGNTDLIDSRIKNYKRMQTRRIVFKFGVTYDTPSEKLKKIPELVKGIIALEPKAKVDRVHFREFEDSSFSYEAVYILNSADYNEYCDVQHEINIRLVEAFHQEGIEFAFPTQTIHMAK